MFVVEGKFTLLKIIMNYCQKEVVTLVFLIRCTQLIMKMKLFILALLLSKTEEVRLVHK